MNNGLLSDFTVDMTAQKVFITREFDAELSLVWDAFTKAELLDQWTAPSPYTARTKHMNFEEGGRRFYAMVSPEGQERWAVQKYISIHPKTNFTMLNAFADENENLQLPGSDWEFAFSEQNGRTTVRITIYNESRDRMEKVLQTGFKEGYTMTLQNLESLLATSSQGS